MGVIYVHFRDVRDISGLFADVMVHHHATVRPSVPFAWQQVLCAAVLLCH